MEKVSLQESLSSGVHSQFKNFVGRWKGTTTVWFERNKVADQSAFVGTIREILGGRFLIHEYKGSFQEKEVEGIAIYGYNLSRRRFESAWIDSFHMSTGIMFSESSVEQQSFSFLGHYEYGPQKWGWRTDLEMKDSNRCVITSYNISPDGEEVKAVEMVYERTD